MERAKARVCSLFGALLSRCWVAVGHGLKVSYETWRGFWDDSPERVAGSGVSNHEESKCRKLSQLSQGHDWGLCFRRMEVGPLWHRCDKPSERSAKNSLNMAPFFKKKSSKFLRWRKARFMVGNEKLYEVFIRFRNLAANYRGWEGESLRFRKCCSESGDSPEENPPKWVWTEPK